MITFEIIKGYYVDLLKYKTLKEAIDFLIKNKNKLIGLKYKINTENTKYVFLGYGKLIFEYSGKKLNVKIISGNKDINGEYDCDLFFTTRHDLNIKNMNISYRDGKFYKKIKEEIKEEFTLDNRDFLNILNEVIWSKDKNKSTNCTALKLYIENKIDFEDLFQSNYC